MTAAWSAGFRSDLLITPIRSTATAPRGPASRIPSHSSTNSRRVALAPHLKLRRPLFRKRLDAFLDFGAAHAVAMAAVGSLFIQSAAGEFVDRALHAAHRDRRIAGEFGRQPVDLFVERFS